VSSAMIAKVGAAARPSQRAAPRPCTRFRRARASRRVASSWRTLTMREYRLFGRRRHLAALSAVVLVVAAPPGRRLVAPLGARSSHWYMPQRPSSPRA
jgi:hypothetical protein